MILAVLGNLVNLLILRRLYRKDATYVYLFWLAVFDLLYLVLNSQAFLFENFNRSPLRSCAYMFFYCKVNFTMTYIVQVTGVYIVTFLVIHRCLAYGRNLKKVVVPGNPRSAIPKIIMSFVLALALYLPMFWGKIVIQNLYSLWDPTKIGPIVTKHSLTPRPGAVPMATIELYNCGVNSLYTKHWFETYVAIREVLTKVLPLGIMLICSVWLLWLLFKDRRSPRNDEA